MKRYFLLIWCICLTSVVFGQENFEKGYYVKRNGEKQAALLSWDRKTEKLRLKTGDKAGKQLGVQELEAMFIDNLLYESQMIPVFGGKKERHMLRVLVDGPVKLWVWEALNTPEFYMQKGKDELLRLPENAIDKEGDLQKNYIQVLNEALEADEALFSNIVHLAYEEKELQYFIRDYNYFNHPEQPVTMYESKSMLEHQLWVTAGYGRGINAIHTVSAVDEMSAGIQYELIAISKTKFSAQAAAYISTGRNPESSHHLAHDIQIVRLPLTVHYQFLPESKVSPYIFAGFMPYMLYHDTYTFYVLDETGQVPGRVEATQPAGMIFRKTYLFGGGMKMKFGSFPDMKAELLYGTLETVSLNIGINIAKW